MKIGLIKEGKIPTDTRVALTPGQCLSLRENFNQVELIVQPSPNRSYSDNEYLEAGIQMSDAINDCDVLLGIKEVPIKDLIPNKTYFFFSHTKKKQSYNQQLMKALIDRKIRMIDYEALTYDNGKRIIGFGFFAGVVGAHNALLTFGKKYHQFDLKPAYQCKDMLQMVAQYQNIEIPPVKIVVTGDGRVAHGIVHIMNAMNIMEVSPEAFLNTTYDVPVFTKLKNEHLYVNKRTHDYSREEFHAHPELYECLFTPYCSADILINGIYWDTNIPRLFEKYEVNNPDFNLSVIADVTCDKDGSVPINLGASSIPDPVYGYNKQTGAMDVPFKNDPDIIDIMAVDNLPNELPRDASRVFGEHILEFIIPELLKPESAILERATICENGELGPHFHYLEDYAFPEKHKSLS